MPKYSVQYTECIVYDTQTQNLLGMSRKPGKNTATASPKIILIAIHNENHLLSVVIMCVS